MEWAILGFSPILSKGNWSTCGRNMTSTLTHCFTRTVTFLMRQRMVEDWICFLLFSVLRLVFLPEIMLLQLRRPSFFTLHNCTIVFLWEMALLPAGTTWKLDGGVLLTFICSSHSLHQIRRRKTWDSPRKDGIHGHAVQTDIDHALFINYVGTLSWNLLTYKSRSLLENRGLRPNSAKENFASPQKNSALKVVTKGFQSWIDLVSS